MKNRGLVEAAQKRLSRLSLFQRIAIGNTLIIILGAIVGTLVTRHLAQQATDWWLIALFAAGGILLSLTVNFIIVMAALRPLRDLGRLAKRLLSGDSDADPSTLKNPDPYTSRMADTLRSLVLQLEERNHELQALSERALQAQEEERRTIAQGLHDDTGQALSMLILQLDRMDERLSPRQKDLKKQVVDARSLAADTLRELRRILAGLRPAILDDLGLVPAIRWYARSTLERAGVGVVVKAPNVPLALPPALNTSLFRIVQEAVNNIVRHAGATTVTIMLQVSAGMVQLRIDDDGRGFHPRAALRDAVKLQQFGLLGIRERVELLNGKIQIDSALEGGTSLNITIPLGEIRGKNPHPSG